MFNLCKANKHKLLAKSKLRPNVKTIMLFFTKYCRHPSTKEIHGTRETVKKSIFGWHMQVATHACDDCPESFRMKHFVLGFFGWQYFSRKINPYECSHAPFQVNSSTIITAKENRASLADVWFGMLLGPSGADFGMNNYWKAVAKCKLCQGNFHVRAEIETVWKEKKEVVKRTTEWTPVKFKQNGKLVRQIWFDEKK